MLVRILSREARPLFDDSKVKALWGGGTFHKVEALVNDSAA